MLKEAVQMIHIKCPVLLSLKIDDKKLECRLLQFCLGLHRVISSTFGPSCSLFVSLMSSLRVISLTVLADSIQNILIFFAEKM